MFNAFYQLDEHPFTAEIAHKWLYLGESHREALAHLSYGIEQTGGFLLLTGAEGSGKTSVLTTFLKQLPENTDVAVIRNPAVSETELLANLCDELSVSYAEKSLKHLIDRLSEYLLVNHQKERHTLVVIDDAQHLSEKVLEQLRLLTNLETDTTKLLQIILIGRPELQQHLNQNALRQIAQRITMRFKLAPLNLTDTRELIENRLRASGHHEPLFNKTAIKLIYQYSGGNPGKVNQICGRALMIGYGQSSRQIDAKIAHLAIKDALGIETRQVKYSNLYLVVASISLVSLFAFALFMMITPQKNLRSVENGETKSTRKPPIHAPIEKINSERIREPSNNRLVQSDHSDSSIALPEPSQAVEAKLLVNNLLLTTPSESLDTKQANFPVKIADTLDLIQVVNIPPQADKPLQKWYVVQVYAGQNQPKNLERFSCGDYKLVIRHHTNSIFITSPNLTLAEAKTFKQTINSRCQLDSWVKPLPTSWRDPLTARSN
ncbi:AAA family ATPase [Shewanella eurypsychrophilus]|uniref:AAA family ATPase n=1 Tax=Shewanella eurypsychrophilus TaxID=2593656 RepID=A0ABX6V6J8_9GAMM|nr:MULTISPECIES: AAA family ATPase [Shewanella]QFU22218.1 AAA family ATPase [Shewanella sp. YLB-09]QPG57504.1 AAA family ATPase [Shewanella eurypsychrophilus]